MSTRTDPDLVIASWLQDEARDGASDRLIEATRRQLNSTNQRRAWWPARRLHQMNTPMRIAVAAAAVVAVAVVGLYLLPRQGGVGAGPSPSPTPSSTPSLLPSTGTLDPGAYFFPAEWTTPARFSFTVPAGWSTTEGFVYKDRGSVSPVNAPGGGPGDVALFTWIVSHAYADACHWRGSMVDAGSTVDELASVLQAQKSRVASTPTEVVLGGFPAKRIDLTTPADLDLATCDNSVLRFWPDAGPDESGGVCCTLAGSTDRVYVVDVAGSRLAVVARHQADSSAADSAELENVVASIKMDLPTSSPPQSSAPPSP